MKRTNILLFCLFCASTFFLAAAGGHAQGQAVQYQNTYGIQVEFTPSPRTGCYRFEVYETGSDNPLCSKTFDSITARQTVFLPVECLPEKTYRIKVSSLPMPGREGLDSTAYKEQSFTPQPVCGHTLAEGGFLYGSGTESDPYIVSTPAQLDHVRQHNGGCFLQTCDLDFSSFGTFLPIWPNAGDSGNQSHVGGFTGTYDGGGHVIKNITIGSAKNYWYNGSVSGRYGYPASLFVAKNMTLRNLGMDAGSKVEGTRACAASFVSGSAAVTALTIERCYSAADINLPAETYSFAGGIFSGYGNNMTIQDCYFSGRVTGINQTAGIAAQGISGSITRCYNAGSCTNPSGTEGDGILGYYYNITSSCYSIASWPTGKGDNLSVDEFAQQESFLGWDFDSTWAMGTIESISLDGGRQTIAAPVLRVFDHTFARNYALPQGPALNTSFAAIGEEK